MPFDSIIAGGSVVTPDGIIRADVGIAGEKIAAVARDLARRGRESRIIDATGHYVLPGAIDVHVHLDLPVKGTVTSDDFRTGTRAAARGGVTTIIDFVTPRTDQTLQAAIDEEFRRAEDKALIDYAFHVAITNWTRQQGELRSVIRRGFPTFKEYMIYASEGWQADDRVLFNTLERMRDLGGMLLVHAESAGVLDELVARHHTPGLMKKYGARLHAMTRPNYIEAEAVRRAVAWSEATGGPLYIVHLSTKEGADIIRDAQARGVPVLAETCPHYLVLDDSVFAKKDGHLFATSPQVKKPADRERLWRGLADGEIAVISTDTCTFTRRQKAAWKGDFTKIPGGLPGLETLLPITYTHGVLKGRLSLERLCEKLSTNPAKIMGLWPRKGAIRVGADADIAIIDPTKKIEVDPAKMETNADWSPYEGWRLAGFARTTLARGEVIVDDYRVIGREGRGRWLRRRAL
ncbi:MAG: dihydropyrimidinase [Phycisphaerae bacterium]